MNKYDFGDPTFDDIFDRIFDAAMDTVCWDANMLLANIHSEINTPPHSDIFYTARISNNSGPDLDTYRITDYPQPWHDYSDYTAIWWDRYREIESELARWAAIWRFANDNAYANYWATHTQSHMADNAWDLRDLAENKIDAIMGEFICDMERMLDLVYDSMTEYCHDETIYQLTGSYPQ